MTVEKEIFTGSISITTREKDDGTGLLSINTVLIKSADMDALLDAILRIRETINPGRKSIIISIEDRQNGQSSNGTS